MKTVNSLHLKNNDLYYALQDFQIYMAAYKQNIRQPRCLNYQAYVETDADFINYLYQKGYKK